MQRMFWGFLNKGGDPKNGFAAEVTGRTQFEGKDWYRIKMFGRRAIK